jgi:Bacterial Ig domain
MTVRLIPFLQATQATAPASSSRGVNIGVQPCFTIIYTAVPIMPSPYAMTQMQAMPEADKRLIARWLDMGAPYNNEAADLQRPVLTITPALQNGTIASVLVGLWDDSPLDYSKFSVVNDGEAKDITPTITGVPTVVSIQLDQPVTAANASTISYTFTIYDSPDRSLDINQPTVVAQNRTQVTYTGVGLMRLADTGNSTPPPPTLIPVDDTASTAYQTAVTINILANDPPGSVAQSVSQPANGAAALNADQTVTYTPSAGFSGTDTFTYAVDGNNAIVTVTVGAAPPPTITPAQQAILDELNKTITDLKALWGI